MINNHRGFTLVELLVSLVISSIVILAVYEAYGMGRRLWHRNEDRRPYEELSREIVWMLRRELAGLYLPPIKEKGKSAFTYYEVEETGELRLSFFTTSPSYYRGFPLDRCSLVTYEYRKPISVDDRGILIRRERLVAGEKVIGDSMNKVIGEGFSSFSIKCQYADDARSDRDRSKGPPRLVQLSMSWPSRTVMGGADTVSTSTQFFVPVKDELFPEESSN